MYRLFDWYQAGEDSKLVGGCGRTPLDQSICLTHLIFLVIATDPYAYSFGSRLSKTVVRLRQSLQRVPASQWVVAPDLLLWILSIGALGARDLPRSQQSCASEYAFFVQHAQLSFASNENGGFTTTHDLLRRVQRCLWIPSLFDTRARRLWAQMGLCIPDIVDTYDSSSEEEEAPIDDEHALGQSTTARFFPALKSGSKKSSPSQTGL